MADYRKIRAIKRRDYLSSFPEEIYNLNDDSHIVRLLDSICGEPGIALARKNGFMKRMQTSIYEMRFYDLDSVYSRLFGFSRLPSETYSYDVSALLLQDERSDMELKDAKYRARCLEYMRSYQFGGTPEGVSMIFSAAMGVPCRAISCAEYYSSRGIANGASVNTDMDFSGSGVADYNEFVVIAMVMRDLTVDEMYYGYSATRRLRPADAKATIRTLKDLVEDGLLVDYRDEEVSISSVSASSEWWQISRTVTGRLDWDGSGWIQANVAKEAPRQLLVNSQEDVEDYTYMLSDAKASSEHVGRYNRAQLEIFPSLGKSDAEKLAKYAISAARSKRYTASYFGGDAVVDWSYPLDYTGSMLSEFTEQARSERAWSSEERDSGNEWIEFSISKTIPVNKIRLNVSRKPVKVIPYLASTDGDDRWRRVLDANGAKLVYTNRVWGGASIAGDMVSVEFAFPTVLANAVRIEFERLDVPYVKEVADNTFEQHTISYSIEASELQIVHEVKQRDDFIPCEYMDMYGNLVDSSIMSYEAGYAVDDDDSTYWLSQPNVGESAVEYIILETGGEKVNYLDIESVFDGCQMNVYSSDDGETWVPYPGTYELISGRVKLPMRRPMFLKLEFTNLCAIPYSVVSDGIYVHTREFPDAVKKKVASVSGDTLVTTLNEKLLLQNTHGASDMYSDLGIAGNSAVSNESADTYYYDTIGLFTSDAYRDSSNRSIASVYGNDMAVERSLLLSLPSATVIDQKRYRYRFVDAGKHEYKETMCERESDLAYVVGIKSIRAGYACGGSTVMPGGYATMEVGDARLITDVASWDVDGDRAHPASTDICMIEFADVQSIVPFRSFDFAVNQKEPTKVFEHPSNMANDWSGYNGASVDSVEFGKAGTVLEANVVPDSGIQSKPKLVRSRSIGSVQADIFPVVDGAWIMDCIDVYGENIFSMEYQLEGGRWNTIGTVFTPQPGGGWADSDYSYRVKVPVAGPISENDCVFVPIVDFDDLETAGIIRGDHKDFKLVFFNGIENRELPLDITDNMEIWFRCQQDLPKGKVADGARDFDLCEFYGSYYLYFGNSSETVEPLRGYEKVFDNREYMESGSPVYTDDGATFDGADAIESGIRLSDNYGSISFEVDATAAGDEHRCLFDYDDGKKRIRCYLYHRQMYFVIIEDGYRSETVSKYNGVFNYAARRILIQWGPRGQKNIYVDGVLSNDNRRRPIIVYIDNEDYNPSDASSLPYRELECINNVYDEAYYNEGTVFDDKAEKKY